jgi:hypothetical protein
MGVILAIAPDAASLEALAPAGPFTLSLWAAVVAAVGLWLWGKQRKSLLRPPVLIPAVAVPPQRSPGILLPALRPDRPRTADPAASSSLLRAPPGAGTGASDGTRTGASPGAAAAVPLAPGLRFQPRSLDSARAPRPG